MCQNVFIHFDHKIKIVFEAFTDADSPVHPFLFGFSGESMDQIELILNKKTNEQLFMSSVDLGLAAGMLVRIKRSAKKREN